MNTDNIHFEISGRDDRPWVVLSHGMGLDSENLRPVTAMLQSQWRVLVWDMPGHGKSRDAPLCGTSEMADMLGNLLETRGGHAAALVGFSFGGVISQILAHRRPEMVTALVAYGCLAPYHQAPPLPPLLIDTLLASYRLKRWTAIKRQFIATCANSPEGRADVARAFDGVSKHTFLFMTRALLSCFVDDKFVRYPFPLLVIRGENDANRSLLELSAKGLKATHPLASEVIIPQAGHCAHYDSPVTLGETISAFLASCLTGEKFPQRSHTR